MKSGTRTMGQAVFFESGWAKNILKFQNWGGTPRKAQERRAPSKNEEKETLMSLITPAQKNRAKQK